MYTGKFAVGNCLVAGARGFLTRPMSKMVVKCGRTFPRGRDSGAIALRKVFRPCTAQNRAALLGPTNSCWQNCNLSEN